MTEDDHALVVAVLGLGEAGSAIAADLVRAGASVRGYDPAVAAAQGITGTASEAEAAQGADLVLSVNSAKAAVDALVAGRAGLRPDPWARNDVMSGVRQRRPAAALAIAACPTPARVRQGGQSYNHRGDSS